MITGCWDRKVEQRRRSLLNNIVIDTVTKVAEQDPLDLKVLNERLRTIAQSYGPVSAL